MTSLLQAPRKSTLDAVPDELKGYPQWVCWRYEWQAGRAKPAKVPVSPRTGREARTTVPETWGSFGEAVAGVRLHGCDGIGFVVTKRDPFFVFDLDGVVDRETGEVVPWAAEIVALLGSYTETSPSDTGLRIFVRAAMDFTKRGTSPFEVFATAGFVTVTGNVFLDAPVQDRQDAVEALCRVHLPEPPPKPLEARPAPLEGKSETLPGRGGSGATGASRRVAEMTDRELLEKARNSRDGERFAALYDRGDTSPYRGNVSSADFALMVKLAYWTGKDPERMERLFGESALGRREKWKYRRDYRRGTIDAAIRKTVKVYDPTYQPRETSVRDLIAAERAYDILFHPWGEKAGRADAAASDYFARKALLNDAYKANSLEIGMGERYLAERGGFATKLTAGKALRRLEEEHGLVRKVSGAEGAESATYEVVVAADSNLYQPQKNAYYPPPCALNEIGIALSQIPDLETERILNPAPIILADFDKNGRRIAHGPGLLLRPLGKLAAWILELTYYGTALLGSPVSIEWLEQRTGIRRNNLKARNLRGLLEAGLIVQSGDGYATPADVWERLQRELELTGCDSRSRLQRTENERQRRARLVHRLSAAGVDYDGINYRTGIPRAEIMEILKVPEYAPDREEMDALREQREIKNADGYISELQPEHPVFEGEFVDPDAEQPALDVAKPAERGRFLVVLAGTGEKPKENRPHRVPRRGIRGFGGWHHLYDKEAA